METKDNFFEGVYQNAKENLSSIPWARLAPNPYLEQFLKEEGPVVGKKALVIGCGLGDDAVALAKMGYDTVAIDIAPSAIDLAIERFPQSGICFLPQDIFALGHSTERYDFIYEGLTIQSLPRSERKNLVKIISNLVARDGKLLVYAHGQEDEDDLGGPPWPLYRREFDWFIDKGFSESYRHEKDESKDIAAFHCCILYERS